MSKSYRFDVVRAGGERGDGKCKRLAVAAWLLFGVFSAVGFSASEAGPVLPRYEVVDLGTLGGSYSSAFGINDSGQVVGVADTASGQPHAFVWDKNAGMVDLGTLGGSVSSAYAINNRGQIVGSARTANNELHAFLWEGGKMIDLGLLHVGSCTEAKAINDAGQVVGNARTSATIYSSQRAFLWEKGEMIDLGELYAGANGSAADINIRGQVVGTSGDRAFLWESESGMELLTHLPMSQGNAINDAGLAVLASAGNYYVWREPDVLTDMNLIRYSRTNAINASGTVVGDFDYLSDDHYHAFLWDESSGMIDLNDIIVADSGWMELNSAAGISDGGHIAGYGKTVGDRISRAFVINPLPPEDYLAAHWELDESSGDIAADSVGDNDGVLKGNRHWQPYSGRMNGALMFDGSGDYVDCGNGPELNISDVITVSAWVTISGIHSDWQTIVAKGDSAWRLSTVQDDMKFHFAVTGGPPWNYINGDTVVQRGEWHHVCGTYDGAYLRLYVDGVEEPGSPVAESNGVTTNDYNVWLGDNEERTGRYWDGMIDDVRVYTCPLTSEEVHALYLEAPIYVDIDAPDGSNDGLSWEGAYYSPQTALLRVQEGGAIHVAAGVYTPDRGVGQVLGSRSATFRLAEGVSIKGGYAGLNEPSPKARDYQAYESILSGDLRGDDEGGFVNIGENSYHVVTGSGVGSGAVLEGFTIRGGYAEIEGEGGGMLNVSGSPTVRDCIFTANKAARGGGMYNQSADPILIGVQFVDNKAFLSIA
ncbi:MAG: LamG-like jellyroll fold domain-containing protein, partial [Planctomycetota bacterium]